LNLERVRLRDIGQAQQEEPTEASWHFRDADTAIFKQQLGHGSPPDFQK